MHVGPSFLYGSGGVLNFIFPPDISRRRRKRAPHPKTARKQIKRDDPTVQSPNDQRSEQARLRTPSKRRRAKSVTHA